MSSCMYIGVDSLEGGHEGADAIVPLGGRCDEESFSTCGPHNAMREGYLAAMTSIPGGPLHEVLTRIC